RRRRGIGGSYTSGPCFERITRVHARFLSRAAGRFAGSTPFPIASPGFVPKSRDSPRALCLRPLRGLFRVLTRSGSFRSGPNAADKVLCTLLSNAILLTNSEDIS